MTPLLATDELTVRFGDFVAVRSLSLTVAAQTVHAVIGPNGAGKTSLFNAISGFVKPVAGRIRLCGDDIAGKPPNELARRGLARSFQICSIFPNLSVIDNVRLALTQNITGLALLRARSDASQQEAGALIASAGLAEVAKRSAADLPYGLRRLLELVTTVALKPKILLLDEPTSGLAREDIAPVIALIRRVAESCGILMVEHNLGVVESLADTVTVMAEGAILCEGSYRDVSRDERVMKAYIGGAADA